LTQIVDISGLADVFGCHDDTIQRQWRTLPHFFITDKKSGRSARFDIDDVLTYLKARGKGYNSDGSVRSEGRDMDGGFEDKGISQKTETRVRNGRRSATMGTRPTFEASVPRKGRDPVEDFASEFGLS